MGDWFGQAPLCELAAPAPLQVERGLASQQLAVLGGVPVVAALAEGRQVQQTRGLGPAVIHMGHGQDHHSRTTRPDHGLKQL